MDRIETHLALAAAHATRDDLISEVGRLTMKLKEMHYWRQTAVDEQARNRELGAELECCREALEEARQRIQIARDESDKGNEVTAYNYLRTALNGINQALSGG